MSPHPKLGSLAGPALRMQPDRRLARLAGEGNDQAFVEIVRRYRARLVAFAAGIVPAHRAEDIIQESLTRVYSALRESDSDVHLAPWLFTIVRNRALNAVRDERVHVELDEQYDGVTPPPEIVARREEVAALVAGIKALPEAQRQALVGRELEGLSHDEIAAQLGTTPTSVRGLIFRARTAVRHAAGAMIPLPVMRWLLADAPSAAAGEAAAGGVAAAGLATASAGGGGLAVKAGAVIAAAALATGAGIGLRDSGDDGGRSSSGAAEAAERDRDERTGPEGGSRGSGAAPALTAGFSSNRGRSGGSHDGRSGPGGGGDDDRDDDSSGSGSGERGHEHEREGDDDHSGPGGGADRDDDSSGPGGGGDDEPEEKGDDHSGSGGGGSGSGSGGGDDDDEPEEPEDD